MPKDKPIPKKKTTKPVAAPKALQPEWVDELQADLQRVQADFVNYRRRAEAEKGEILAMAKQDVISHILPMLDTLDRGLSHLPAELEDNPVAKQAQVVLKSMDIERIEALGQPFDPHLHEAISHEGDGETVVEELQPGYRMGDKVIRHAIVKVGEG
jgi:molecular chaperone GrpE